MRLPFILLQFEGDKPDMQRLEAFYADACDEEARNVKVGQLKKKSKRASELLTKKLDFKSRRYKQADANVKQETG